MAIAGIARLLLIIFVGRTLGDSALSLVSAVLSIAVLTGLAWPTSAGIIYSMYMRSNRLDSGTQATLSTWLYRSVLTYSLLIFAGGVLVAILLSQPAGRAVLIALVISVYGMYTYLRPVLITDENNSLNLRLETLSALSATLLAVLLLKPFGMAGVLLAFIVMFGIFVICSGRVRKFYLSRRTKLNIPGFVNVAISVPLSQLLTNLSVQLVLLASIALNAEAQAAFIAAAFSISTPISMVGIALAQSATPHLTEQPSYQLLSKELNRILLWFIPTVVGLYAILALTGNSIVSLVYGFSVTSDAFIPIFAFGLALFTINLLLSAAVNALHRPHIVLWSYTGGLTMAVSVFLFLQNSVGAQILIPSCFALSNLIIMAILGSKFWRRNGEILNEQHLESP